MVNAFGPPRYSGLGFLPVLAGRRLVEGEGPREPRQLGLTVERFSKIQCRRTILRRARERVDRMALREPLRWGACGYPLDGKCHHGSKQCFCRFAAVTICVKRALAPRFPSTIGSSTSRDRTRSLFPAGPRLAKPGHALFVPVERAVHRRKLLVCFVVQRTVELELARELRGVTHVSLLSASLLRRNAGGGVLADLPCFGRAPALEHRREHVEAFLGEGLVVVFRMGAPVCAFGL